jgi:hypothetical protein
MIVALVFLNLLLAGLAWAYGTYREWRCGSSPETVFACATMTALTFILGGIAVLAL